MPGRKPFEVIVVICVFAFHLPNLAALFLAESIWLYSGSTRHLWTLVAVLSWILVIALSHTGQELLQSCKAVSSDPQCLLWALGCVTATFTTETQAQSMAILIPNMMFAALGSAYSGIEGPNFDVVAPNLATVVAIGANVAWSRQMVFRS